MILNTFTLIFVSCLILQNEARPIFASFRTNTIRTQDGDDTDEAMVSGYRREYLPRDEENSGLSPRLTETMVRMLLNLDNNGKLHLLYNFFLIKLKKKLFIKRMENLR